MRSNSGAHVSKTKDDKAGLAARNLAVRMIEGVLSEMRSFDEVKQKAFASAESATMQQRDRAFARLIATAVLRDKNALDDTLANFIEKPLPSRQARTYAVLLSAAAQLLILKHPAHAAINTAVQQIRQNNKSTHLAGFANAVLRRVANEGAQHFDAIDRPRLCVPDWMWRRWEKTYGADRAYKIAQASHREPSLDITIKSNLEHWQKQLNAQKLAPGSLRLSSGGRIESLPGYNDGDWWVQDAGAALPARLFGNVQNRSVLDLCAAPGGKTAQLAAAGARVTAVEVEERRCARINQNLTRLQLSAKVITADVVEWTCDTTFDAVLLDAPCSATGTMRRHPDIFHLRREHDIDQSAKHQSQLLDKAFQHLSPGGQLVFATCSIEPEEGVEQIASFLARTPQARRVPISSNESGALGLSPDWVTPEGDLTTLPFHDPRAIEDQNNDIGAGDMDGFFAARIERQA